ncbi:MAG: M48 family metalloprotease [Hyphomicrobiales bacterium]|nr:M48 family metalloprotease [Hyphomicrobiales bacterium]
MVFKRNWMKTAAALLCAALSAATATKSHAQGGIRDAEIEALMAEYSNPVLRAAGLASQNIRIHLINDRSFNAFVVDGQNMFLHVGAIMKSSTPNQLIGVIAHEAGHIEGSHISRMHTQIARAQHAALFFQILGMAAMAGGALGGGGNDLAEGGAALMYGGQSAAMRSFLNYKRSEEYAADQAAMKYLNATKQSGRGMLETFRLFAEQASTAGRGLDPYAQTHPLPQERMASLQQLAMKSPYFDRRDPPELQLRHDMVRAKLHAFLNKKNRLIVLREYPESNQGLPARYARAISACYTAGSQAATPLIDDLIASQPNNPYFHEFKGQCLMEEGGSMAAAVAPLRRAVQLAPKAALIRVMLAQALLATNNGNVVGEAVENLKIAVAQENTNSNAFLQLANAYARLQKIPDAELATAQAYLLRGRITDAKRLAQRAQSAFPIGSPSWIRANDILATNDKKRNG